MYNMLVNCCHCRTPLQLPPGADSIRCAICQAAAKPREGEEWRPPLPSPENTTGALVQPLPSLENPTGSAPPDRRGELGGEDKVGSEGQIY
ncbi:hypothetical protein ACFX2C_040478 [Malus domestica]